MQTYANTCIGDGMPSTSGFDQLFATTISAVFALYLLRCVGGAVLLACSRLPTRWSAGAARLSAVVTPRLARKLLVVLVGVGGTAVTTGPAMAAEVPDLDRGPVARASVQTTPPAVDRPSVHTQSRARVQVRPGDCLWSLARTQLPVGASAQLIDRQWQRWYALNRERIGANPNLIRTGQWLQVPSVASAGATK